MKGLYSARTLALFVCVTLLSAFTVCWAQESRGSITGKVVDPQNAVMAGVNVTVTNTETNVSRRVVTNQTGYYEVVLLGSGTYSVSAEAAGFKKAVRSGVILSAGDRLAVDLQMAIGVTTDSVVVTAEAPLLDITNAAAGRLLNSRDMAQLPYTTMNPFAVQAMAAGMIFTGAMTPDNNRALDHASTANFASGGLGTGTNEFLLDGNPITGTNGGRAGFVPNAEAVDEVRIETSPYDASLGHALGAFISATTKSGTNGLHGAGFWQFQQFRWNAAPHFTRLNYQAGLANGTIAPGTPEQASGRVTQPGFGVGGPVYIPKVINGKNKLFFYISYSKLVSIAPPNSTPIYTVPTLAERTGDFSALLVGTTNPSQYIVYDPRSAKTVSGHATRTPFANNTIPASMQTNPIAKFYSQLYPLPNNPSQLQPDGTNNFFDGGQPNNDWFPDFVNRYDYTINDRQRVSGKWFFNSRFSDQYDWAHDTPLKGLESNGLWRPTRGGSLDYLVTLNANNVLDVTASIHQYSEGDKKPIDFLYNAQSVGLPSYIDQKAGSADVLPWINIAGVANAASTSFVGAPGLNQRGTTEYLSARMTTVKGSHSFKYGWEERRYHYASVNPLGSPTGYYQFSNNYDKQADNTASTATTTTGLGYASYLMGLPNSMTLDTNDTGYWSQSHHSFYFQDDFRITSRLRIGFGLRYERAAGITERFNRGLEGQYDFSYVPPYASAVQSAYTSLLTGTSAAIQTLQTGMPASQFIVAGGVSYLGQQYSNYTQPVNRFLPNVSLVYQINSKTVLRFGTGWYSDTYNPTNSRPGMNGYSQQTSTILTNDNGLTFCCGVGAAANMGAANPLMDPFPVNPATGSRWVMPFGNSLGAGILAGQGFTYLPRDFTPTWQQRYSLGVQRELHGNHRIEVSYNGGYASQPMTRKLGYLPAQYWNFTNSKSTAADTAMQATVANPFLAALPAIKTSNPALYGYLSNVGLFTGTTLQVQQLLRGYPNAGPSTGSSGLQQSNAFRSKVVDNEVRVMYQKRWSQGFQSMVQYTHMWGRQQWLPNEFDQTPAWQLNSNIRPNRLVWTNVVELPFGKNRHWLREGPLAYIAGGWQLSWVYTYQTGALISWGNQFYFGDIDQVAAALNHDNIHSQNLHMWFDPAAVWTSSSAAPPSTFVGLEGRSSAQPGTFQARVFPQYIDSLRADGIRNWDAKILRKFTFHERIGLVLSTDLLNLTNHTQFSGPNLTVTSSAFGSLSGQSNAGRILQFATRLEF